MRFDTTQHPCSWGSALHARPMDLCILDQAGETLLHRHMTAPPRGVAHGDRSRPRSARPGGRMPVSLGLAGRPRCCPRSPLCPRSCPLSEGPPWRHGQKRHDRRPDNRGGAARRSAPTGRWLSGRAARHPCSAPSPHAPGTHTWRPPGPRAHYPPPVSPACDRQKIADKAHRHGGAARWADPAVPQRIAGALALIGDDDPVLRDVARPIVTTAQHPDATTRSRRHTVPGSGKRRSRGRLAAMPERALPAGAGWCLRLSPRHGGQGSRGQTLRHLRNPQWPRPSHGGRLRSRRVLRAREARRADIARPMREQPRHGARLDPPGSHMGTDGLLHVHTPDGLCSAHRPAGSEQGGASGSARPHGTAMGCA